MTIICDQCGKEKPKDGSEVIAYDDEREPALLCLDCLSVSPPKYNDDPEYWASDQRRDAEVSNETEVIF